MTEIFIKFIHEFSHLTVVVLPYFIIGIVFGALLEAKLNFNIIYNYLNLGKKSIFIASILGAILPGCACATMPMAEGLRRKGAKMGTLAAFMFTSPLLAPQTIILTYGLLGPNFTIARITCALIGGCSIGLLFYFLEQKNHIAYPPHQHNKTMSCCNPNISITFTESLISITKQLSGYFIIGMAIAAALSSLIPPSMIPNTIGNHPLLSYLIAAVIGIPIYICEGEEIPITYSLLALGLAQGPAFTFLMGAVGTCIPTMLFAKKIIGKKSVLIYALYWAVFAPLAGMLFSLIIT